MIHEQELLICVIAVKKVSNAVKKQHLINPVLLDNCKKKLESGKVRKFYTNMCRA